ncbi:MAG: hypothetical protein JW910_01550 [Anaerolineae bacterium]|nr:hypothetical protein [Anaerolineae bacterium]
MNEEQRKVLELLQAGRITSQEANRLLVALGGAAPAAAEPAPMSDAGNSVRDLLARVQAGELSAEGANALLGAAGSIPAAGASADAVVVDEPAEPMSQDDPAPDVEVADTDAATAGKPESFAAPPLPEDNPLSETPEPVHFRRYWQLPFVAALGVLIVSAAGMSLAYSFGTLLGNLGFLCAWSIFMLAVLVLAVAYWSRNARWLHVRVRDRSGRRVAISLPVPVQFFGWGIALARRFVDTETQAHLDTAAEFVAAMHDDLRTPGSAPLIVDLDQGGEQVQVYFG